MQTALVRWRLFTVFFIEWSGTRKEDDFDAFSFNLGVIIMPVRFVPPIVLSMDASIADALTSMKVQ
jgi:hypothetical protein